MAGVRKDTIHYSSLTTGTSATPRYFYRLQHHFHQLVHLPPCQKHAALPPRVISLSLCAVPRRQA